MKTRYYNVGDAKLTLHEMKIISLIIQFTERWQVAEKLHITKGTLQQELKHVYLKLKIHCLRDMLLWAWKHGFASNGNYRGKKIV